MTDRRTQHARAQAKNLDGAGFDVWLPAVTAILAALFLIWSANAQEAAPRAIYSADRFAMSEAERTLLEEQAARAASAADSLAESAERFRAATAHVEMQALPDLSMAQATADARIAVIEVVPMPAPARPVLIADPTASEPSPGWLRLVMALAIATMLGGALYLLDRTWRRTEPALPRDQAVA
jgi:hypothetical protein